MAYPTLPSFPKFDLDAFATIHKGNLETAFQAQKVLTDAAQAMAKLNADWLKDVALKARAYYAKPAATSARSKPEAVLADAREAAERGLAVAREGLDVGVRAQGEVVDLLARRAAANLDSVKAFAAPAAAAA